MSNVAETALQTYNGWKNWETWNVNLWVMNEVGLYQLMLSRLPLDIAGCALLVLEMFPNGTPDMEFSSELKDVDFGELVEAWNEE